MGKILLVPDVHGRSFWREAKNRVDEYEYIIFLGDYLDPYPWEGITWEEAEKGFIEILNFKKEHSNKVVLLIGNHDYHYIDMQFMDCSRLNHKLREHIHNVFEENKNLFQLGFAYLDDKCDYLFTHAGVYEEWLHENDIFVEDILNKVVSSTALSSISLWRGGVDNVGSCIWADIHEYYNHTPAEGWIQYVGHSQQQSHPHKTRAITCVDCRRLFELDPKTNKLREIKENE